MGRNLSRGVLGIPLSTLVTAQALFLLGALVSGILGVMWPVALVIGSVLALPWVIHVRGRFLTTVIRTRWSYLTGKRAGQRSAPLPQAFDITGPDGDRIGVRWDGEVITSMIRLLPVRAEVTSMRGGTAFTRDTVPLRVLAESLDQFDIALEGIDVVCLGARTVGDSLQASVYERLLGPLPAIARRNTWLTVRFRPRSCPDAVARRGGDTTGALRTAAVATTRIVRKLAESGHAARALPALDANAVIAQLTGGVPLERFEQRWDCAASPRELHTGFVADHAALAGDALAPVWGPSSRHTALTLQIRPAAEDGSATVGAIIRYLTANPVELPQNVPLRLLAGRQHEALLASLPFGGRGQAPITDPAVLDGEALEQLSIPASGCGQLVGADGSGNAIAVRIAAPDVRRVDIVGGLFLAQQVTLRAIAIGARVLVHTDRPHAWQPMVDAIGDEQVLRVAGAAAASSQASGDREYSVMLLDGVESTAPRADLTVIRLLSQEVSARSGVPDIRMVQRDVHEEAFELHIGDQRLNLSMVSIPDELRIIGASQPGRRPVGVG